ncbi:MAG: hypothetical protein QOF98_820 [Streptomyces sp.]|jgi:Flp pilus assembly protein TadB|nr:hypothetical protein [Streptomyces sp.]
MGRGDTAEGTGTVRGAFSWVDYGEDAARAAADEGGDMSNRTKVIAGGVVVGLVLLFWVPWWVTFLIIVGIPVAAYLTLDSSQRRRLRRVSRRQIGR